MHGTDRQLRTHVKTISAPAYDQLQPLLQRTRLSNTTNIALENAVFAVCLLNAIGLSAIFIYGVAHWAAWWLRIQAPSLPAQAALWGTIGAAVFILASIERFKPGFMCRLLWQCTLRLLGWPRRRKRVSVHQLYRVPLELEVVEPEGQEPVLRWRYAQERAVLESTQEFPLSECDDDPAPTRWLSGGALPLGSGRLCAEWTRDPDHPGTTYLRLRDTRDDDPDAVLDLRLDAPGLAPPALIASLPALRRNGVTLTHDDQRVLITTLAQTAQSLGLACPLARLASIHAVQSARASVVAQRAAR